VSERVVRYFARGCISCNIIFYGKEELRVQFVQGFYYAGGLEKSMEAETFFLQEYHTCFCQENSSLIYVHNSAGLV
jgi:hypothetical protein